MTTLETLAAARARIADTRNTWQFSDWDRCTCGHIAAVSGVNLYGNDSLWTEIAHALGREPGDIRSPRGYISDATIHAAKRDPRRRGLLRRRDYEALEREPVRREAGLAVIDQAIAELQARQADDLRRQVDDLYAQVEEREPALA